jgi:hypothetical protein
MEVSLGPATQDYMKHFQFEKTFFDDYRSFLLDPYRVQTEGVHVSFRQESYPMTVKVSGSGLHSVEDFRKASDRVIESFFFSISVQDDICLGTATRLEQITPVGGKRGTDGEASELPTLKAHYNPEVLRFYWLGGSSEIPQHRFLAYYQVLEYFFLQVSEEELYNRLRAIIHEPSFMATSEHLDRIIKSVEGHRRETDEKEMLKGVMKRYLDESEVIAEINRLEDEMSPHYTVPRNLFGEDVQIDLREGHVFGTLANTIKTIRNALVHSSDRYERLPRFIPYTESEQIVEAEVPLMRFLAERIVVATSKPLASE